MSLLALKTELIAFNRVMNAVLEENVPLPSLEDSIDEMIDGETSEWLDWDSQSVASGSVFTSGQSASTQSSLPHLGAYALREKLTSLITEDADITRIYLAGIGDKSVGSEDITRALRSGLRQLGKQLGQLSSPEQQACAKVIRKGSRYIAEAVRRNHDPEYREMKPHVNNTPMNDEEKNRYIMSMIQESRGSTTEQPTETRELDLDSDSSGDDDDEPDTEAILLRRMKEVEESIWNHPSMAWMKVSLTRFVVDRHTNRDSLQNLSRKPSMPELIDRWFGWIPQPKPSPIPPKAKRISWKCVSSSLSRRE